MTDAYTHPEIKPFFSREYDNGLRYEQLYVLSDKDGVLVSASAKGNRFECTRVLIPSFPGASPYNFAKTGDTELLVTEEDVTDYIDVVGERTMQILTELVYEEEDE
jgi:hypothetical protein